jgi:hypothetical protein
LTTAFAALSLQNIIQQVLEGPLGMLAKRMQCGVQRGGGDGDGTGSLACQHDTWFAAQEVAIYGPEFMRPTFQSFVGFARFAELADIANEEGRAGPRQVTVTPAGGWVQAVEEEQACNSRQKPAKVG